MSGKVLQNIQRRLVVLMMKAQKNKFLQKIKKPSEIQRKLLKRILKTNENTVLQKKLGVRHSLSVEEYRKNVALTTYDDYKDLIKRMMDGERNLLTSDKPVFFALTSGTSTGIPKSIPYTAKSLEIQTWGFLAAMAFIVLEQGKPLGKGIYFVSSRPDGYTKEGIPFGSASVGGQYLFGRKIKYDATRAVPLDCAKVVGEKMEYLNWLFAMDHEDLAYITALYPLTFFSAHATLQRRALALIEDMGRGTLTGDLDYPDEVREAVLSHRKPNPERAKQIRALYEKKSALGIPDLWPNLGYLITAKGGSNRYYVERVNQCYGDVPIYSPSINGSEGLTGIGFSSASYEFIPAITATFLEYVPFENIDEEQPETRLVHELEVDKSYEIVSTTMNGLYRYRTGDIIKITGIMKGTSSPRFEFLYRYGGKYGGVIAASWEKTDETQIYKVMERVFEQCGMELELSMIGVDRKDVFPMYRIVLEKDKEFDADHLGRVAESFDKELRKINYGYEYLRGVDEIKFPYAFYVEPGSIKEYFFSRARETAHFQVKIPRICDDEVFWNKMEEQRIK